MTDPQTTKKERERIQEILRQLTPHAPAWVKILDKYILKLERLSGHDI